MIVEILRQFARSWNNLNIALAETLFNTDVRYYSQWADTEVSGKDKFLSYLEEKYYHIKNTMQTELITLSAELAIHPGINNRPCIILKQVTSEGITLVMLLITCHEEKISRIDACYIPQQHELIMTGECPK